MQQKSPLSQQQKVKTSSLIKRNDVESSSSLKSLSTVFVQRLFNDSSSVCVFVIAVQIKSCIERNKIPDKINA